MCQTKNYDCWFANDALITQDLRDSIVKTASSMVEHIAAANPTSTMIDKIQPLPMITTTVTGLHAVRKPMHIKANYCTFHASYFKGSI